MEDPVISMLIAAAFALLLLYRSVRFVPQGEEHTVERFGRFIRTITPGISFIVPLIDSIGEKVDMREQALDIPPQDTTTRDDALVRVDGTVFYQVFDAAKAAYEVGDMKSALLNLALMNLRAVMGEMNLDKTLSGRRDEIGRYLLSMIGSATAAWGVKVARIEIKDIVPRDA